MQCKCLLEILILLRRIFKHKSLCVIIIDHRRYPIIHHVDRLLEVLINSLLHEGLRVLLHLGEIYVLAHLEPTRVNLIRCFKLHLIYDLEDY